MRGLIGILSYLVLGLSTLAVGQWVVGKGPFVWNADKTYGGAIFKVVETREAILPIELFAAGLVALLALLLAANGLLFVARRRRPVM